MIKTQWHPRTFKKYPDWSARRVVTGGYHQPETVDPVTLRRDYAHNEPRLVRYDITYQGKYFFSTPTYKEALQVIKRYYRVPLFLWRPK